MIVFTLLALVAQDPVPLHDLTPLQTSDRRPVPQTQTLARSYNVEDLIGQDKVVALEKGLLRHMGLPNADADAVRHKYAAYEAARATANHALADIQSIMQASLEPAFDEERHLLRELSGGQLMLLGSAEQHSWVQSYLGLCREFHGLIHVTAEIVSLPPGSLNALVQERNGQVIPRVTADSLLLRAKDIPGSEVVQTSTIAVPPFRKATMVLGNQVAYIQDFEILVLPEAQAEIVDPVIGIIEEGTEMEVSVTPIQDGRFALNAHLSHSVLQRPIPTLDITIGTAKHKGTIQLPEVLISRLKGKFDLGIDESLAIASTGPDGQQELLLLMSVQTVPEDR